MLRALLYAYVLGGLTFIPLVILGFIFITVYTSVPVGDPDVTKKTKGRLEADNAEEEEKESEKGDSATTTSTTAPLETNDMPRTRKGWLTMRRTFEESATDGGYVTLVRSFLDSRSKDPKRSRPKDMWYVVLKGKVLYLYEDEEMSECEAAVELSSHQVVIYPEGLPDGELFAKRNAICLKPRTATPEHLPSVTKEMKLEKEDVDETLEASSATGKKREVEKQVLLEEEKKKDAARDQAMDPSTPWFIFVRSNVEMEDWYFALIHASEQPAQTPTLHPLRAIFEAADMNHLVSILDDQPDVIPMRWLNALLGRIFFSHYRTHNLEAYIIGRLMKKLSKVKMPAFLSKVEVTEVSVGNKAPMLSKPMLKELTKEGDASLEVHLQYKGEIRITVEATAVINLGARFKSYTVKLTLAAVLKELEGNLLIKVKRPPSNRIWYAFTQTPRMVLEVEPIVSDRQITWGMILSTIESKFKEIIQESVVMPNMDDIAYFETGPYEHRGGIYADACRKPHAPSPGLPIPQDDAQTAASVPLPDAASMISTDSSPSTSSTPTPKPDDASTHSAPPSLAVPLEGSSSTSSVGDDSPDSIRGHARRRTWFSSVRSEDLNTLSAPNFFSDGDVSKPAEEERGRTLEPERVSAPRSKSTPNQPEVRSGSPESIPQTETLQSKAPSVHSTSSSRRSVSQQITNTDQLPQVEEPIKSPSLSTPNTPRKASDASQVTRSPSPPSFFSTLKSKAAAADKQAISNTAKEAIRKWGVNWGGFKKEASTASQSSDDGGSSPPRPGLHPDVSKAAAAHNKRASYAEVRAAVAERKERERTTTPDDGNSSDSSKPISPPTSPFASRMRVLSNPKANGSVYTDTGALGNPSIVTSAAASRLSSIPRLASKKSTPSLSTRMNPEGDSQESNSSSTAAAEVEQPPVKPAPIHVQPVAKTMSIPGIHASHRGEVQSMGYMAPTPIQPTPSSGPVSETMLKNPAIQSVYRLWKNPSAQGQGGQQLQQEGDSQQRDRRPSTSSSIGSGSGDHQHQAPPLLAPAPNLLSPAPQASVKPSPPPLPPRSSSQMAIPLPAVNGEAAPGSSASDVLKNIAQKHTMESSSRTPALPDGTAGAGEGPTSTSGSTEFGGRRLSSSSTSGAVAGASVGGDEPGGPSDSSTQFNTDLTPSNPTNDPSTTAKGTPPALPPRRIQTLA